MVEIVAEFFGIIGVDVVPPETLSELIPYLLTVFVGIVLVCAVFKVFGGIVHYLMTANRRF